MSHVTSGNVTINRTNMYQGNFTMPQGDVTIQLSKIKVGGLDVGSWVTYNTSGLSSLSINGNTYKPSEYSSGWRIIYSDGDVAWIFPVASVGNYLDQNSNWGSTATYLNQIAGGYVNADFASTGRSPKITDITLLEALGMTTPASFTSDPSDNSVNVFTSTTRGKLWVNSGGGPFRPIIILKPDIVAASGDGTASNPFVLEVDN